MPSNDISLWWKHNVKFQVSVTPFERLHLHPLIREDTNHRSSSSSLSRVINSFTCCRCLPSVACRHPFYLGEDRESEQLAITSSRRGSNHWPDSAPWSNTLAQGTRSQGSGGPWPYPLFCWTKKIHWQKRLAAFEVLQRAPLHLLFHKKLVPLMYIIVTLKSAPAKEFFFSQENRKPKISPPAPTMEAPPGATNFSTVLAPHF